MTQQELFAKALMVEKPWYVHEVGFDQERGKLEIWIDFERGSFFYFEDKELGIKGKFKAYDTVEKTWRHLNFFQYECYLHAWIPRVDIGKGKKRQVKAPWEGQAFGFTLLFEAFILELVRVMPVHQVSQLLGVYDSKLWKKNHQNLTQHQKTKLESIRISGLNLKTMKAVTIREAFQQIYQAPTPLLFEKWLKKWYFWATHSRMPHIIEAAKTIKRHWDGVINWIDYQISNGILEGFNSIFQAAKAKARGYKKTETIKTIIYILTGKLDFSKVNPYYVTHSIL